MLTGIVLARNEAANLGRSLDSLKFCDYLLVIDDDSVDATVKIAHSHHARAISHSLNGDFSAQRNFAVSQVKTGWVLFVDADEVVSPALAAEIASAVTVPSVLGYYLPRLDYLWNRPLLHGDVGGVRLVRLGRAGVGRWQGRIHETWSIQGNLPVLHHPLLHNPHADLAGFLRHLNFYSTLRASELSGQGQRGSLLHIIFLPPLKFANLWLVKLGFLDGTPGFIHAMFMAFYTFLVRGKLYLQHD